MKENRSCGPSTRSRIQLGRKGEDYAVSVVTQAGLMVIERNFRCPKGEADIIASDRQRLIFIEVRTRSSGFAGWGEESITSAKAIRMQAVAAYYVLLKGYRNWPALRFDLMAIRWVKEQPEVHWLKGIF